MKAGKLGLAAMLFSPLTIFADEMDVHLLSPPSNLLISRQSGKVVEVLFERGAQVEQGDILLSISKDNHITHVRSTSGGVIQLYSKKAVVGEDIRQGDILAEIVSHDIKGELIVGSEQAIGIPLDIDAIYCCLHVGEKTFEIRIEDSFLRVDSRLYRFSVVAPGPELYRLLDNPVIEKSGLVMKISFDNPG